MSNTLGAFFLKRKILNETLIESSKNTQESPRMKQFHEKLKIATDTKYVIAINKN